MSRRAAAGAEPDPEPAPVEEPSGRVGEAAPDALETLFPMDFFGCGMQEERIAQMLVGAPRCAGLAQRSGSHRCEEAGHSHDNREFLTPMSGGCPELR